MLTRITPYFVIISGAMHLFCCGLPLFLSITSLTTFFGISSLGVFEIEWFEEIENYVLILSGVLLFFTLGIDSFSKKINCLENGVCSHPPCEDKKHFSSYVLRIAIILFLCSMITLLINALAI